MQKLLEKPSQKPLKRLRNTTGKQEVTREPQFARVIYTQPLGKKSRLGNELRFIRLSGYTHILVRGQLHSITTLIRQFAPNFV